MDYKYCGLYNKMADSTNSIEAQTKKIPQESPKQRKLMLVTLGLLTNIGISNLTYIVIIIIEFLQVFGIVVAGNYYTQWDGVVFDKIKYVTTMFTIQGVIQDYPSAHTGLLIACILLLILIFGVVLLLMKYGSEMLNTSQMEKVLAKIASFVINLVKTILQIPMFVLIIQGIITGIAETNAQLLAMSLTLTVILIPYSMYAIVIFSDLNPFNESVVIFSGEISRTKLTNTCFKLGLVLYNLLDTNHKGELVTLIFLILIQVILITLTHWNRAQQQFNKYVKLVKLWLRYVLVIFLLFMIICYHTSSEPTSFIFFFIMIVSSLSLINFIQSYFQNRILYENFMELEDPSRIESHALRIIELIDSAHERPSKLLLQGYIAFHVRNCNLPQSSCLCRELSANKSTQIQNRKQVYYQMLVNLLRGSIPRTSQPRRIYLLLSYIYQHRLKNRYQAIHCLIRSRICTTNNIMERIQYLTQMKLVQQQMVQTENKKHNSIAVDMMKFLHFNIRIVEFQKILDQCTNNHIDFWNQILQVNLNIQKLQNCGAIIANEKQAVKEEFHEMIDLNSNNAHIMILYGQFLAWVCNQDFQHSKLLEKGETILKNMKQSSKINGKNDKYSENSKTTIIIISGNEKQMGKIVQTNNFIKQTIGYNRKQLINHNISKLMPKVFAEHHNSTLARFLTTSKDRYNGIERLVPVLCQQGFIVPSLAYTKPIPNLIEGIQIVGFLSEYNHIEDDDIYEDKISYILYQCDSQTVMGISKSCQQEYGIPKCLVYGSPDNSVNQLKTKHIFGFNLEKNSEHGIQNGKQILATIDTKLLQDQFIISSVASTRKIIEENAPRIQTKNQVILRSVLELVYHGIPLRLISITKEYNQKEQEHRKSIKQVNDNKEQRSDSKSETDDLKDLKDFKNFISVKRQPKAIRFVSLSCKTVIGLFILGVASFIFLHIKQLSIISSTMKGLELAFLKRMYLTELLFQAEKVFIDHNDKYLSAGVFPEIDAINKMNTIIKSARETQMNLQPIKNSLEVPPMNVSSFIVYPNKSLSTMDGPIDEAIIVQLTKLTTVANTGGDYLKASPVNYQSVTVLSYLETIYTQIFSFTYSCSLIQQAVQNQGKSKSQNIELVLILISVSLMLITIIWLLVSLPKTLQVADINSKVLSLFSLIASEDVRGVIKKCYIFQSKYLVQSEVDVSKIDELNMQDTKPNKFRDSDKRRSAFGLGFGDMSMNTVSPNSLNNSQMDTSARVILNPTPAKSRQVSHIQNFDDGENEDKMINKGNGDKTKAIIIFVFVFIYMTAFAGSIMGYLMMNYRNMSLQSKTMNQIYNRTAQFQELKIGYTKYLMDRTLNYNGQTIDEIDLDLIDRMYDTERFLVQDQITASFMSTLNRLNTENICNEISNFQSFKIWGEDDLNSTQCETVNNGILKRGIKTSLVTIMEQIRSMIALPEQQKLQMKITNVAIETMTRYTILEKYLVRPLLMVSSQIVTGINSEYFHINLIFYMISGVFLLTLVVFWKFAWSKYLDYLNQTVWRTKSMLNVIPSKIITNNQLLMSEFTSGQLEKIVK